MRNYGPCMCGAIDCPSCGPAQGYEVVRVWRDGRYTWINPEEQSTESDEQDDSPIDEDNDD